MNINRNNCESFFLDYYEKNLSPVEVAEVLFFLEENPDLKDIFESYEAVSLEHEKVNFPDKESLKKKYSKEEIDIILSSEINKNNCEQFFVASAEEILSDEQARKLYSFLAAHPEYKKEFELFQKLKLSPEKISFEHKNLLKKESINAQNREEYFVRAIEEDLSAAEQKQLATFLQKNPDYNKELDLFKQTILVSEKIEFEFKSELKKRERKPVVIALFSQRSAYYAAAAAILLLMGLFFFFRNDDSKGTYLANNKPEQIKSDKVNVAPAKKEQGNLPQENTSVNTNSAQTIHTTISVNKNAVVLKSAVKEKKDMVAPVLPEIKSEDPLMAKKEEIKKENETPSELPLTAKMTEPKTDSAAVVPAPNEAIASVASPVKKEDEYQTVASAVNKKIRSVLGIQKSTECETSDKIDLWDLAMAAKRGVQKIIGTKTIDVNKVCDGAGGKVEYVFAAGNFEISKNVSR